MSVIKCRVHVLQQDNQSKHPSVGTLCHNYFYEYFIWSQLHTDNGSRTNSQEYKAFSMRQLHIYFLHHDGLIQTNSFVYHNGRVGRVMNIVHGIAVVKFKLLGEEELVKVNELVLVVASTDDRLDLPKIPVDWINDVFIPSKGQIMFAELVLNDDAPLKHIVYRPLTSKPTKVENELTAKQLQEAKIKAEIKIMNILKKFNAKCVANDFQLETITLTTTNTDQDRTFDVDIHIV